MKLFHLTIVTPQEVTFSAEVAGLMVPGAAGAFGVLADHAPIISTLTCGVMTITTDQNEKEVYQIGPGFIDLLNNQATVITSTIEKK